MEMADGNEAWASANTFFFEQTPYRRSTKRFKKHPEELPQDLRFAHLNPRVAAYLSNKEKEKVEELEEAGVVQNKKSLLPQITETVNLIRQQLNAALSNDENSQRFLLEQAKAGAAALLPLLAKILNVYQSLRSDKAKKLPPLTLPRTLENTLQSSHRELTTDIPFVPREWQLPQNREEYMTKMMNKEEQQKSDVESIRDGLTPLGSNSNLSASRSGDQDDARSVKSAKSSKSNKETEPTGSGTGSSTLKVPKPAVQRPSKGNTGRNSQLSDILENDEIHSASRADQMPAILQGKRAESKEKVTAANRPKTRLEKFRSNSSLDQRGEVFNTNSILC